MSSTFHCPECQGENTFDSRFCRFCGASLDNVKPLAAASAQASSAQAAPSDMVNAVAVNAVAVNSLAKSEENSPDSNVLDAPHLDARRAHQLLDRALFLFERADTPGAILACRQSIALSPEASGGHAMLGMLLERAGDFSHAVVALEKAVQLAPDSATERENLDRLREKLQSEPGGGLFHFDDNELFGSSETPVEALPAKEKKRKKSKKDTAVLAPPVAQTAASVAVVESLPVISASHRIAAALPPTTLPALDGFAPGLPHPVASPVEEMDVLPNEAEPVMEEGAHSLNVKLWPGAGVSSSISPVVSSPILAPAKKIPERRARERRRQTVPQTVPVERERRRPIDRRIAVQVAALATSPAKVAPLVIPNFDENPARPQWNQLWARPSFYGRSLPLVATAVLSLGFLSWARTLAVARAAAAPVVALAPDNSSVTGAEILPVVADANASTVPSQPPSGNPAFGTLPALPAIGSASAPSGFPISNGKLNVAVGNAATSAPGMGAAAPRSQSGPREITRIATGRDASRTARLIPPARLVSPAPLPPLFVNPSVRPVSETPKSSNSPFLLPAPEISSPPAAEPPVSVIPFNGGAPALNPAGNAGRGYVRITQGHIGPVDAPLRPAGRANTAERSAAASANAGQTDRAIEQLTTAINANSSDGGFRLQQRATLFLDRGDYSRAADDFQAAISAYNAQIGRGENIDAARAGLRAARSGLNLALAGKGR